MTDTDRTTSSIRTLAVDIGGSGVKVMVLDEMGTPLSDRLRVPTPQPPKPDAVIEAIVGLATDAGEFDRASVGFPGVVRQGVTYTAVNLDPDWQGFDLAGALQKRLNKPIRVGERCGYSRLWCHCREGGRTRHYPRDGVWFGIVCQRPAGSQFGNGTPSLSQERYL